MNSEDIAQSLTQSFERFITQSPTGERWEVLRDELLTWIQGFPKEEAFAGLISAIETSERYQIQWLAGDLLLRAAIPCPLPLNEWLERVIANLNASADTVVRYSRSAYDRDTLVAAVNAALEKNDAVGKRRVGLQTMLYF